MSGQKGNSNMNSSGGTNSSSSGSTNDLGNKGYFRVGSHIKCRYQGEEVEGEVMAFESNSRLLIIRAPASNGKSSANNVFVINANCIDKISVEDRPLGDGLKPIDFNKLGKRRDKSIGSKQARIRALAADVSPEGKKIFLSITKAIGDDVHWEGLVIMVLGGEVRVKPPYKIENVEGEKDASVKLMKKVVEKYWKENGDSVVNTGAPNPPPTVTTAEATATSSTTK